MWANEYTEEISDYEKAKPNGSGSRGIETVSTQ
jgi:hypothetical protein